MSVSILEEEGGRIAVRSPYHPNFPARAAASAEHGMPRDAYGFSTPPIMIA